MYRTAALLSKKRSLALSVHFKQPKLGMTEYEILSRASAFLVWVDPPEPEKPKGKYSALEESVEERAKRLRQQERGFDPAGGPRRNANQLGWLEYCPSVFRPQVHCLASSHVLSPWLWPKYYSQDWLKEVKQEDCKYSLQVYEGETSLATFDLAPFVIHHPTQLDLAMIHLKDEQEALRAMAKLDLEIFHMRDNEILFEKNEDLLFDGFWIAEDQDSDQDDAKNQQSTEQEDDSRIFHPYQEPGKLIFASPDRFLASTTRPLPEGMCGGPAIDRFGTISGIVEGIVPIAHEDKQIAGAACLLPSPRILEFIEASERMMLQQIVPADVFEQVVALKSGDDHTISHTESEVKVPDDFDMQDNINDIMAKMKKYHSTEEISAIQTTIQREKEEVLEILQREGGDMDEIIGRVRTKTLNTQQALFEMIEQEKENFQSMSEDAISKKIDAVITKAGNKSFAQQEKDKERKRPLVMINEADYDEK